MHELNKDFTKRPPPEAPPPPVIGPPEGPAAVPAEIDPSRWEDFAVFRETFLVYVSHARYNAALRVVGEMLFEMVLETWDHWPERPEGYTRSHLRAAVADLRHLQGYLATQGENPPEDEPYEAHLCRMAVRMSREVGGVAEQIEKELGPWRGEPS